MANEATVHEILEQAGYQPIEGLAIIVKYAPKNLSAAFANFFSTEFYVLQICEHELAMVPFTSMTLTLKKEVALEIPLDTIHAVDVFEEGFNYRIDIAADGGELALTAQQKELSGFRSAGTLTLESSGLDVRIWHDENLDRTLAALKAMPSA